MKFLLVLVLVVGAVVAQERPDKSKWTPLTCRSGNYGPNDARMAEIGKCEPKCNFFCQATALGLLNGDGKPSQETYDTWVTSSFPAEHKTLAVAFFRDCYQKYGQHIDLDDTECKEAQAFGDCTWSIVPQLTCAKE